MPRTQFNVGEQGASGTIVRADMNTATAGSAVITKIITGDTATATLAFTGADSGTGDVTITVLGYYNISFFVGGSPLASEGLISVPAMLAFSVTSASFSVYSTTAATASTTFTFLKNGTSFGTAVFAAAGTVPTLSITSTSFAVGDKYTITAPATPDTTLANISFNMLGTR
jgi:hypothetical protein